MPAHDRKLADAGFSDEQIEALLDVFTLHHHHHDIDEVDGLQEELDGLEAVIEDEEDE